MNTGDLMVLRDKIVEFLRCARDDVHSWNEFPFDMVKFGEYTANDLRHQWLALKQKACGASSIETDMVVINAFLTRESFIQTHAIMNGKGRAVKAPEEQEKRALNAYQIFLAEYVKGSTKDKGMTFAEAASVWRSFGDEEKEKYLISAMMENLKQTAHKLLNKHASPKKDCDVACNSGAVAEAKKQKVNDNSCASDDSGFQAYYQAKYMKYAGKYSGDSLTLKLREKYNKLDEEKKK